MTVTYRFVTPWTQSVRYCWLYKVRSEHAVVNTFWCLLLIFIKLFMQLSVRHCSSSCASESHWAERFIVDSVFCILQREMINDVYSHQSILSSQYLVGIAKCGRGPIKLSFSSGLKSRHQCLSCIKISHRKAKFTSFDQATEFIMAFYTKLRSKPVGAVINKSRQKRRTTSLLGQTLLHKRNICSRLLLWQRCNRATANFQSVFSFFNANVTEYRLISVHMQQYEFIT